MADKPSSTFGRYCRIWWRSATMVFATVSASRVNFMCYVIGKLVRMCFFFVMVIGLFTHVTTIAGYRKEEVFLFFAIMNVIDILVQLIWFRGLSDFQRLVRKGDFDFILAKPMSPLFWAALRQFDFFDLTTVPVAIFFLWYAFHGLGATISSSHILLGMVMLMVSLLVAFFLNLCLAAWTFWTVSFENVWWLYRYAVYVARFPPEIFPLSLQWIFTYIFPILVIVIFPTKAFLGKLSSGQVLWGFVALIVWGILSTLFWRRGIKYYTSASS